MEANYDQGLTLNKISTITILLAIGEILATFFFIAWHWEFALTLIFSGIIHLLGGLGLPNYKKWAWVLLVYSPLALALAQIWTSLVHPAWWYWIAVLLSVIIAGLCLQKKGQIFSSAAPDHE